MSITREKRQRRGRYDFLYGEEAAAPAKNKTPVEIRTEFMRRQKEEQKRFKLATDSEYWVCVCFQTRAQKEAFLAATGWAVDSDKYVDGELVAQKLGVRLESEDVPYNVSARVGERLANLAE